MVTPNNSVRSVSSGHAEAAAILAALLTWASSCHRGTVQVMTDSMVIVNAWASQASPSPAINSYIRAFAHFCSEWSATLVITHLPGTSNGIADAISRQQVSRFRSLLPSAPLLPCQAPSLDSNLAVRAHMESLHQASVASSSLGTYEAGRKSFRRFVGSLAEKLGLPLPPTATAAQLRTLLQFAPIMGGFIAFLSMEGKSPKTIQVYLNGLTHLATDLSGEPLPLSSGVKQVLRGALKEGPPPQPLRPDVSLPLLEAMLEACQTCTFFTEPVERAMWRALFSLAFFGCMRASEYVSTSRDPAKHLMVKDVVFVGSSQLVVWLKKSKTNQHGPPEAVMLQERPGPACPVRCMRTFIDARRSQGPLAPETLLFGSIDHGNVSSTILNATIRRIILVTGAQHPEAYSSHSFRIAAAPPRLQPGGWLFRTSRPWDAGAQTRSSPTFGPAPSRLVRPVPSYLWSPAPLDRFPCLSSCTPLPALLRLAPELLPRCQALSGMAAAPGPGQVIWVSRLATGPAFSQCH